MNGNKHVVIVGGGISGMATAYELQEAARTAGMPISYTLLERDGRLGGKIATERAGGFVIEGGPDCFISQKPWAADLCRRIGIGDQLMGTNDERRKVYVLDCGQLTPLPDGVMLIIPTRIMPFVTSRLISWPGKLRMGMDLVLPRRANNEDESVADFVRRRLGTEALEKIAEPLMSGIHVSDPEMQSILGTFPRFRLMEEKHRSLILGMLAGKRERRGNHTNGATGTNGHGPKISVAGSRAPSSLFITLRDGLGSMVERLASKLEGTVLPGISATAVERDGERGVGYRVHTSDGGSLRADAVVLATPAYVSARLIDGLSHDLAKMLAGVRYVSTATVSLGFKACSTERKLAGFGYVVPRREKRQVSACTYTSIKFDHRAPEGMALLRCFVGGPGHEELVDLDDDELVTLARCELGEITGLRAEPVLTRIFRWRSANPQYDVGHPDRVRQMHTLASGQPGLFITGSAYDGVGVPDCVRQGQQAAQQAMAYLRAAEAEPVLESSTARGK